MSDRTHFVYRAFDAEGLLLYIGCTGNPGRRYRTHMSGGNTARGWFDHFVVRWHVSGPYPRATAFALEKRLIEQEQPIWNGHSERNRYGKRELINEYLKRHNVRFVEGPVASRPLLVSTKRTLRVVS